ncbi:MAG: transglutaminase-like domain-containing protein [Prevotellaceae bacterium]|nr:transglutaminase-like domain-containing protein [Prevotellaceae bacterium]
MSTLASSQELIVAYAGGGVTRTLKSEKLPVRTNDKVSYSDFVTIEYGGKLDLLDVKNSKRIILKSPGAGKLSVLALSDKNNVAELTKSYMVYMEKQLTNRGLFSKQRQSDFATVTRSIQIEEDKSDKKLTFEERIEKKYREFYEHTNKKFYAFRDECNQKYADFLRKAWTPTNASEPVKMPKERDRHPSELTADTLHTDAAFFESIGKFIKKIIKRDKNEIEAQSSTAKPIEGIKEIKPEDLQIKDKDILTYEYGEDARMPFSYFGTEFSVRLDETKRLNIGELTKDNVADAFVKISKERMLDNLLMDCLAIKDSLNLCDWGYLQLLDIICNQFCGEGTNESALLMGYLYGQSGYKLKYAMDGEHNLYVLVASKHSFYDKSRYWVIDDWYYPTNDVKYELEICPGKFENEQGLSLFIAKPQLFADNINEERTISSKKYPDIQIKVKSNKNILDFYNSYPRSYINYDPYTIWLTYAETPMNPNFKNQIYPELKEKLAGLSDYDKVSRILNFLQTGLEYQYDDSIWGMDRAFFPEETLSYPYCDCEDHAILFTRLVRDLVGLECRLVYYPGHMAAAVHFNEDHQGVYYVDNETGKRFMVCDPTIKGIGCPIGTPMDIYSETAPILIPLEYPLAEE